MNEQRNEAISSLDTIATLVGQTALNVQSVSQQMGILTTEVKDLKVGQRRLEEKISQTNDRMDMYEQRITVDRNEASNIRKAIHHRAAELLDIYYVEGKVADECVYDDVHYRGGFISKCYTDSRKYSRLGTPFYATYHKDYLEVLDYISKWAPEAGVEGYKDYLDERRRIREDRAAKKK